MKTKIFRYGGFGDRNEDHQRKINELTRELTSNRGHSTVDRLTNVEEDELLIVAGMHTPPLTTMLSMLKSKDPNKERTPIFIADPGYIDAKDLKNIAKATGREVIHSSGFGKYKVEANDDSIKCSFDDSQGTSCCFKITKPDGTEERQKTFEIANNKVTNTGQTHTFSSKILRR